jgi:hypothetical protein
MYLVLVNGLSQHVLRDTVVKHSNISIVSL